MPNDQQFGNIILPGESRRRQKFYLSKAKLTHAAPLSAFMAGFAIRSVANLQINEDADDNILTLFVVTTTLLVITSSFVIITSMWVLPLLKTSEQINSEIILSLERQREEVLRSFDLEAFAEAVDKYNKINNYEETANSILGLKTYRTTRNTIRMVEIAWILAGTVSVFLFTIDVIAINWVKFRYFTMIGAIVGTTILVTVLIALGFFGLYFRFYFVRKFKNITKKLDKNKIGWRQQEIHGHESYTSDTGTLSSQSSFENREQFFYNQDFRRRQSDSISTV